eukprot:TRINITY_DN13115_c0_g3_i3.p1 TRINITY_DN13115_c0_g3~~TRINITY_DN13115_c0_g3_i3.p1  ORF type:complete len:352 (+),score=100.71 TRINITY_DN13115_c0_g3_i3:89-1057(+)
MGNWCCPGGHTERPQELLSESAEPSPAAACEKRAADPSPGGFKVPGRKYCYEYSPAGALLQPGRRQHRAPEDPRCWDTVTDLYEKVFWAMAKHADRAARGAPEDGSEDGTTGYSAPPPSPRTPRNPAASARHMLQGLAAAGFCKLTEGSEHSTTSAQSPAFAGSRHTAFSVPQPPTCPSAHQQIPVPGRGGGYHRPPRAPRQQVPAPRLALQPPTSTKVTFCLLPTPIKGSQGAAAAKQRKKLQNRIRRAEEDECQHRGRAALDGLRRDRAATAELRRRLSGIPWGVAGAVTLGRQMEQVDNMVDRVRWRQQRKQKGHGHWQ